MQWGIIAKQAIACQSTYIPPASDFCLTSSMLQSEAL
jgi:hypothetical protein